MEPLEAVGIAARRRPAGRHRDEGGRGVDRGARRWTPLLVGDDGSRGSRHSRSPARGAGGRRRDGEVAPGPHSARGRAADSGGRRPGARRARAPAGCGRRRDGPAPDRVGDAEHRSLDPRRQRGRVGASGGASAGGAGAKSPLAPRSSRGSVVQGSERDRGSRPKPAPAMRPTRGCGASRERGPSGSRPHSSSRSGRSRASWRRSSFSLGPLASPLRWRPRPGRRPPSERTVRAEPVSSVASADPPGWERIHEGSFPRRGAAHSAHGRFPGTGARHGLGPILFGRPPAGPDPRAERGWSAWPRRFRTRTRAGSRSRSTGYCCPARELDRPRVHGPEPGGRGRASGPSRSPLLQHVRCRRSRRCRERTRPGRRFAVRPEGGRRPGDSARARPRFSTGF